MIKYECCTDGMATELKAFIIKQGFKSASIGCAVLSDMPGEYAGTFSSAMVKIIVPNEGDSDIELEG